MFKIPLILLLGVLVGRSACAQDEFHAISCGSNIPKLLVGEKVSNGRAVVVEGRHKNLGLKDLGGTEISDHLFLESWSICGTEFELLVNTKLSLIRDALSFPPHSVRSPMFIGQCEMNRIKQSESVVAVLDNSRGYNARDGSQAKTLLQATNAWKIDEAKERFFAMSPETITCSADGIITEDGGY